MAYNIRNQSGRPYDSCRGNVVIILVIALVVGLIFVGASLSIFEFFGSGNGEGKGDSGELAKSESSLPATAQQSKYEGDLMVKVSSSGFYVHGKLIDEAGIKLAIKEGLAQKQSLVVKFVKEPDCTVGQGEKMDRIMNEIRAMPSGSLVDFRINWSN